MRIESYKIDPNEMGVLQLQCQGHAYELNAVILKLHQLSDFDDESIFM